MRAEFCLAGLDAGPPRPSVLTLLPWNLRGLTGPTQIPLSRNQIPLFSPA